LLRNVWVCTGNVLLAPAEAENQALHPPAAISTVRNERSLADGAS
jgi:hypothetical protein